MNYTINPAGARTHLLKQTYVTAATLLAVLCYIDSGKTPSIAYDDDSLAKPLADKLRAAVGKCAGSQEVMLQWVDGEDELLRQFQGCCQNIAGIFSQLS